DYYCQTSTTVLHIF
nr:immunoglobulin light chain junction region [Macaca mulatta]MOY17463.1 immunoglobulin light chain junction region [Macaca mulatta]